MDFKSFKDNLRLKIAFFRFHNQIRVGFTFDSLMQNKLKVKFHSVINRKCKHLCE